MAHREASTTFWERVTWIASWVAPLGWSASLLLFALLVAWPELGRLAGEGRDVAWLVGFFVLLGLSGHVAVMAHGTVTSHFSRDEKAELRWKLHSGAGYSHWRRLMRKHERTWHKGRSASGARPKYD